MSDFWNKDRCERCGRIKASYNYVGTEIPCYCDGGMLGQGYSDGAAMWMGSTRAYYIVEIRPEQWSEIVARLERIEQKVDAQEPFHTAQALIRSGKEVSHAVLDHLLVSLASEDEAVRVWAQNALNGYVQLRKRQEEENK